MGHKILIYERGITISDTPLNINNIKRIMNELKIVYINNKMVRMLRATDAVLIIAADICTNPSKLFAKYDDTEKCMAEIPVSYADPGVGIPNGYTNPPLVYPNGYTNPPPALHSMEGNRAQLNRTQKVLALTEKGFSRYINKGRSAWTRALKDWYYAELQRMRITSGSPQPASPDQNHEQNRAVIDWLQNAYEKSTEPQERLAILESIRVLLAGQLAVAGRLPLPRAKPDDEALIAQCIEVVRAENEGSVRSFQRHFHLSHSRAWRIMAELERRGVVGPARGTESREVLSAQN